MQRFNVVVPWFKLGKIWFPEEMKTHPAIVEALEELSLASPNAFKSRHDDFCFPANTPIITKNGIKPIVEISIDDLVLTRNGWKKVLKAWCSGYKEVITRFGITATPNHLIFTENKGWVTLDTLDENDIVNYVQRIGVTSCESQLSLMKEPIIDTQMQSNKTIEGTSLVIQSGKVHQTYYTEMYGNTIMDQSQKDIMFIMPMETGITTTFPTLYAYQQQHIEQNIEKSKVLEQSHQSTLNILNESEKKLKLGILPQKVENGIDKMLKNHCIKTSLNENALSAVNYLNQQQLQIPSALMSVEKLNTDCIHEKLLGKKERVPVYDLTVEDAHEFFAWGFLVHNCDTVSMLASLKAWKPSEQVPFVLKDKEKDIWELDMQEDDSGNLHSYIV
jgi:hypothetical protein